MKYRPIRTQNRKNIPIRENQRKKQQSRVQTIQRTVTGRNVAQDNGSNINKFWKGSR